MQDNYLKYQTPISLLLLLLLWLTVAYLVMVLPATIPVHFNFSGMPDRWGSKKTLWVLPIIASMVYVLLAFIKRMPAKQLNYPVALTVSNQAALHQITQHMLSALQIGVLLLMGRIVLDVYLYAAGKWLPSFFGVMVCVGLFVILPVVYYITKMFRIK
jgi:uncharacterized membrane protein